MENTIQVIDILENKISVEQARNMVIIHQNEAFTYFDEGCTRFVFVNKDKSKVIKINKSNSKNFNQDEIDIWDGASEETRKDFAKTNYINLLIEQEFVLPIKYAGIKLNMEQIRFAQSCRNEVGWKDG